MSFFRNPTTNPLNKTAGPDLVLEDDSSEAIYLQISTPEDAMQATKINYGIICLSSIFSLALIINAMNDMDDGFQYCSSTLNILPFEFATLGILPNNFIVQNIIKCVTALAVLGFDAKNIHNELKKLLGFIVSKEFPAAWKSLPRGLLYKLLIGSLLISVISFGVEAINYVSLANDDNNASFFGWKLNYLGIPAAIMGPFAFLFSEALQFTTAIIHFFIHKKDNLCSYLYTLIKEEYYIIPALISIFCMRLPSAMVAMLFSLGSITKMSGSLSTGAKIAVLIFLGLPKAFTDFTYLGAYNSSTLNHFLKCLYQAIQQHKLPPFRKIITAFIGLTISGILSFIQRKLIAAYIDEINLVAKNSFFKKYFIDYLVIMSTAQLFITYGGAYYDLINDRFEGNSVPSTVAPFANRYTLFRNVDPSPLLKQDSQQDELVSSQKIRYTSSPFGPQR